MGVDNIEPWKAALMTPEQLQHAPYILVAPNGARRGISDHHNLPVTTEQIVAAAQACFDAGAQGIHLHVRDENGQHSLDAGRYIETIAELHRVVPEMDVQITTEAADMYDVSAQLECLERVCPKWVSIAVREIARSPELVDKVYGVCAEQGTQVQHILYDADDAAVLGRWQEQGLIRSGQTDRLLVLGRYVEGQQSNPKELDLFPTAQSRWMACAFGRQEHECLLAAARRGGDVRVGFENSMTDRDDMPWKDNGSSVKALVVALKENVS